MLRTQLVLRANNNAWCVFRFHFSFSPQLQHISSNKHPHFFFIPCLLQIAAQTPKFSASLARIPQIQWHIVMHLPLYFVFHYRSAHPFVSMSTWRKQQTCSTAWSLTITKRRKPVKTMAHSGNQMMHSMRQYTRPNYSPWHFWMDIIALQLLWSKPWTISKDEQSYNLPSRTSKIYIHLWSKKTSNRSLFGFSTNMHPFSDTPDNHSISSYKDWIFLRTPPAVSAHHMGRHNKPCLPARERKRPSHSCRTYTVVFDIIVASPSTSIVPNLSIAPPARSDSLSPTSLGSNIVLFILFRNDATRWHTRDAHWFTTTIGRVDYSARLTSSKNALHRSSCQNFSRTHAPISRPYRWIWTTIRWSPRRCTWPIRRLHSWCIVHHPTCDHGTAD